MHNGKIKIPIIKQYYKLKQRKSSCDHTGMIQLFEFKPNKKNE